MKISILTATYNREQNLYRLYNSILENSNYGISIEWLIMDDGSTDNSKFAIDKFIEESVNFNNLEIKYFYQKNMGKMCAINNLINKVSEDSTLLFECDSDDYLCNNAIKLINSRYENIKNKTNIYAIVFLKYDQDLCNIGNNFKENNYETNMFNLYFKDGISGDKSLVFLTSIRKKYKYIIERNENFSTEARLHNQLDKLYNVVCFNKPLMICEYKDEGYSKNIKKIFKENPLGYYEYFKQLLSFNMKNVLFPKRLYIIKHYILFSYLAKKKNNLKNIPDIINKLLFIVLFIPGIIKSYIYKKKD